MAAAKQEQDNACGNALKHAHLALSSPSPHGSGMTNQMSYIVNREMVNTLGLVTNKAMVVLSS